ncbi:MAG: sulfotransferase [bacterium]|nr:sulfotransferase [bacterium]
MGDALLDPAVIERAAAKLTGLEDFGGDDWREALGVLLGAIETEAELTDAGRRLVHGEMVGHLVNRLEIQHWVERHPEIRNEVIAAPLVIATLPRTGQTAAGWLMHRDPGNRSLISWQAKRPCPPPGLGVAADDPRIVKARAAAAATPGELRAMHLTGAEEPDECHWLLSNACRTPHQIYAMRVPSHYAWARAAAMRSAYVYHRLQLQLLQWRLPPARWVLKNSPHLLFLEDLAAVYPDAHFVQFHRDPLEILASNCSLALFLRRMRSEAVDPHEIGESILRLLCDYVEALLRFRRAPGARPWIDVAYTDFIADPLREVERIYGAAGISMSPETRTRMAKWIEENPRGRHGRHEYHLAPFGIERERARACFAEYCEVYCVPFGGSPA